LNDLNPDVVCYYLWRLASVALLSLEVQQQISKVHLLLAARAPRQVTACWQSSMGNSGTKSKLRYEHEQYNRRSSYYENKPEKRYNFHFIPKTPEHESVMNPK